MYFPDLSIYEYAGSGLLKDVLTVGWLDRSVPFPQGPVPSMIVERLKAWFMVGRVNLMRGVYECNLCRAVQWPLLPLKDHPSLTVRDGTHLLGKCEIWIPGPQGKVFASPGLIIHYIETHQYCPPDEYIAAVMNENAMEKWDAKTEFGLRTSSLHSRG